MPRRNSTTSCRILNGCLSSDVFETDEANEMDIRKSLTAGGYAVRDCCMGDEVVCSLVSWIVGWSAFLSRPAGVRGAL